MPDPIDTWLAACPDPARDPIQGMRQAGLLSEIPSYATIAQRNAALVERTGLLGIASVWGGPQLVFRHFLTFGTDAQRAEWTGRALSVAISEPNVGAHPKLLTTRAEAVEGGFRITGQKAWVSNGTSADAIVVFAITSEADGRKRYSAFIVPRSAPGLITTDTPGFHALRPSQHCFLTLSDCFVPVSAMLGEPGLAYERMALPFRDIEDAVGASATLGAIRHALGLLAGTAAAEQVPELGGIAGLTAVFANCAAAVADALDAGAFRDGDATLVGLRLLATDLTARLRTQAEALASSDAVRDRLLECLGDVEATLAIARGPRVARQTRLGEALARTGRTEAL
jgi:acyl-CoA dehydrogenase